MNKGELKGTIFNIERFAYQDGPGIRTLVFLKECPLNCKWCCNPESQDPNPVLMHFKNKCIKCGRCLEICPNKAIEFDKNGDIHTNKENCILCGKCTEICPNGARLIKGEIKTVKEVMREILKDDLFYRNSGGGVTLSGGEPLQQIDFSLSILKNCKDHGIHTAMETSLYGNWTDIKKLLDFLDLIMVDIKHMDSKIHKKFTGVKNDKILTNIKKLTRNYDIDTVIRIPILPGINDSQENIKETASFASNIGINKIEILPYHELGLNKYKALDKDYELEIDPPTKEYLIKIKEIIKPFVSKVSLEGNY